MDAAAAVVVVLVDEETRVDIAAVLRRGKRKKTRLIRSARNRMTKNIPVAAAKVAAGVLDEEKVDIAAGETGAGDRRRENRRRRHWADCA